MNPLAILAFARKYWKVAAGIALALALWWAWHQHYKRVFKAGGDAQIALYAAAQAKATADHNAKIAEINEVHHASEIDLAKRLQAAVDKPPAVRIVRIGGVQNPASCPAPVASDAGQPEAASADTGSTGAGEEDYRVLRDQILQLGADAETWRRAVVDAQQAWPR